MSDSQHEANKVVRVLNGKPLKYTVRIARKAGDIVELQASEIPDVTYDTSARELWLQGRVKTGTNDYSTASFPIMRWADVDFMTVEVNPEGVAP